MKARCIKTTGRELGQPRHGSFYSQESLFSLTLDAHYPILGLGLFDSYLLVLLKDDTDKPNWLPAGLFEWIPQPLPSDWKFAIVDAQAASGGERTNRWIARWGYPELIENPNHSNLLIERDETAMQIFYEALLRMGEDG
jgi:hypothetical protein